MYICNNCNQTFKTPKKTVEKHGLSFPPYEIICVCPSCKSQDYEFKNSGFCRCCGAKLPENKTDYCSEACQNKGEKLFKKQQKHKQKLLNTPVYKAVREVEAYNKRHHTSFSYGQFFALFSKDRKESKKIG